MSVSFFLAVSQTVRLSLRECTLRDASERLSSIDWQNDERTDGVKLWLLVNDLCLLLSFCFHFFHLDLSFRHSESGEWRKRLVRKQKKACRVSILHFMSNKLLVLPTRSHSRCALPHEGIEYQYYSQTTVGGNRSTGTYWYRSHQEGSD